MKIDVIACYYKQAHYAPFFFWGIHENRDAIGHLFIVNDGLWEKEEMESLLTASLEAEVPVHFLEHPRPSGTWHGVAKSLNQGIEASKSEYVFTMSFDQILSPNCIKTIGSLASPDKLVRGAVHTIRRKTQLSEFPSPVIIRQDFRLPLLKQLTVLGRKWHYMCNGHTLIHRTAHKLIGGFNEKFCPLGYGLEDYDYGVRFSAAFGVESCIFGPSFTWHFGYDPEMEEPQKASKKPSVESFTLFERSLETLYGRKFALFSFWDNIPSSSILVSHTYEANGYYDVPLDCITLDWMEDNSAVEIIEIAPNAQMPFPFLANHFKVIECKLASGGNFHILIPAIHRMAAEKVKTLVEKAGLEIDVFNKTHIEASKP